MARKFEVWFTSDRITKEHTSYFITDAQGPELDVNNRAYRSPIATFPITKTHGRIEQEALADKLCRHLNDIAEKAEMAAKLLDL